MPHLDRRGFLKAGAWAAGSAALARPAIGGAWAAGETLTLYNGQHEKTTRALIDVFSGATGIRVNVRQGGSSQLANQLIEEGDASPADVFYSEESPPLVALANRSMLATLEDDTLKQVPPIYAAKDRTWVCASLRSRVVAYNKAMVSEGEFPASVLGFAAEAWKDRVAYVPTSGALLEQIMAIELLDGRDAALEWLKGLKAYGRLYPTNGAAMKAVEDGEIATALINNYYWFSIAQEVGDANMKSALFYYGHKDPGALISATAAGVLKSSRKQDLARRFVAFMVSEGGQQAIVDSMAEYPVRPGIESTFALKPFDELDPPAIGPADIGDAADALVLIREAGLA